VAVERRWGGPGPNERDPDWFNIETWGRLGEVCQQCLHKGRLVYLEGRLQTDQFEKDGERQYFTKVVAQQMQMLDRRALNEAGLASSEAAPETLTAKAKPPTKGSVWPRRPAPVCLHPGSGKTRCTKVCRGAL
jgi:single stranded DNA-binding protein